MRAGEIKRMIGYYEPKYDQFCGNCANCKRKGTHLRCSRFKIAVQALGMCRNGWDGPSKPLTAKEAPLLIGYDPAVGAGETAQVVVDVAVDAQNTEEVVA